MRGAALLLVLAASLALQACREGDSVAPPLPDPLAELTRECQRGGGRMMTTGRGQTCLYETRDAGRQCRRATDCESDCLARSGTCAPARPMFGCHEILMNEGQRAMLCRD